MKEYKIVRISKVIPIIIVNDILILACWWPGAEHDDQYVYTTAERLRNRLKTMVRNKEGLERMRFLSSL